MITCSPSLCSIRPARDGFILPSVTRCRHFDELSMPWNELIVTGKIIDLVLYTLTPISAYHTTPISGIDPDQSSLYLPWETCTVNKYMDQLRGLGVADLGTVGRQSILRTLLMDGVQWAAIAARTSGISLYPTGPLVIGKWRHHEKMEHVISAILGNSKPYPTELQHGATLNLLYELSCVQFSRRLVFCEKGNFALALDHVGKGDKTAILHGARTPIVLEPRLDGKFDMIDQCFYDGAMYGGMADADDTGCSIFTLV